MRLANKVAVITGAGSGIGREAAIRFASEGARVVIADINARAGNAVVDEINENNGQALFVATDVTKASDVANMIATAEETYGGLHILFNNAGIMHPADDDVIDTEEQVWDMTMNVNLKGVFFGCKYGVPALRRSGGGSIINTASFAALLGSATPLLAYAASKGGVLAMSRELAITHAREKIRVNALCPGPMRTEVMMKYLDTEEKRKRRLIHIPLGRFGETHEIANAALFLASDESSFITGSTFVVDGGISAAFVTPEIH
jgi:NAD(P)-dependent dehydrogenase (short-subunit alcohol dehydrogenase family)